MVKDELNGSFGKELEEKFHVDFCSIKQLPIFILKKPGCRANDFPSYVK